MSTRNSYEKNFTSLGCGKCYSSDITIDKYYEVIDRNEFSYCKEADVKKTLSCTCNKCGNKYDVVYNGTYRIYEKERMSDNSLLVEFETEDTRFNFKLYELHNTFYDEYRTKDDYIYLLTSDEIEPPIYITKEFANDVLAEANDVYENGIEPQKTNTLIYNTNMQRNR